MKRLSDFAGTLVHELIHAKTGLDDVSRDFETELTRLIGIITESYILNSKTKSWFKF